jgi:ParB family chromosome partitioning protein
MKIKIANIDIGNFAIREKFDEDHVKQIFESLKMDGQWNPIIVRPKGGGRYDLIAGHYRLQASKELGWEEIEALVKDLTDVDADFLSLKTNIMHSDMTAREQGQVLHKISQKYKIPGTEIARKLNVSNDWVNKRIRLSLNLHEKVIKALENGKINFDIALVIGSLESSNQPKFLEIIIDRKISQTTDAIKLKGKFLNDTIYTIGYQGKKSIDFIRILQNNKIEILIDVRHSAKSEKKPEFSKAILKRELERNKIKYRHYPELGIPFVIQAPYKEGKLSVDCLKQWYKWQVEDSDKVDFINVIKYLKDSGRPALMCMEKYAKKIRDQKYSCHRDILAKMILNYSTLDTLLKFENRIDL